MQIILVGADLEENLGIGMIAAAAEAAGHEVSVVLFNETSQAKEVAEKILTAHPHVVGLSIQFQHRAREFFALARCLRACGYGGHITTGGQFPTMAYKEVLSDTNGVDSVVLHDGEASFVELLRALELARPLKDVPGLAILDDTGGPLRTPGRRLVEDLDLLPFPKRYRPHTRHVGVPFIPVMGGRGCWGRCSFCSIISFYRDARAHGGGRLLRYRTPDNLADEMAALWHNTEGKAVFCFHDDNLLLPRPDASLQRLTAIKEALDRRGVGQVGFVGKCRPDTVTRELALALRVLGVIRLYVGVENASEPGAEHLRRGVQTDRVREALRACREAGIFTCYNMLMFEPDATLDDIEANIAFIREHAVHPVNFGRAEPYFGTPLQVGLSSDAGLTGTYLGHGYRIKCDRTELLFRICATAFRQRNYDPDGVHNRYMGVGYAARLLEQFHGDGRSRACSGVVDEATELTRRITLESATLLEEALELAREADLADGDRIVRETALLGLRVAEADRWRHAQLDRFYRDVDRLAVECIRPAGPLSTAGTFKQVARLASGMALSTLVAAGVGGCEDEPMVVDPDARPLDSMVVDPDAAPLDTMVVDPDVSPLDSTSFDAVDPDAPPLDTSSPPDTTTHDMVVDPDAAPLDAKAPPDAGGQASIHELIDRWRDTAPRQVTRSTDLPLFDPPAIKLTARGDLKCGFNVRLVGSPGAVSTRWEGDGTIEGQGREVSWFPDSETDQIRVGVRSLGGVAVAALRAGGAVKAGRVGADT